jgi:transcriptional regulator with XRE-family HTH domain
MTGKQLRKARLARGLSTEKAAKLAGVARRTWVRWETLRKIPTLAARFVGLGGLDTVR